MNWIAGVTSPDDIEQGADADGPTITLVGLQRPTGDGRWFIRYTRPRFYLPVILRPS